MIRVDQGRAELWPRAGASLDARAIRDAVIGAGFTPGRIAASLMGKVESRAGRVVLALDGSGAPVLLSGGENLRELQDAAAGGNTRFRVDGTLESDPAPGHSGHPPLLMVDSFSPVGRR